MSKEHPSVFISYSWDSEEHENWVTFLAARLRENLSLIHICRTPHETANQLINNIPYPKPREINDNIPESVERIIMKLLKRNPEERYQNVGEVKRDFEKVLRLSLIHI